MALAFDRPATLKWTGDFTLNRYRAKLANQYLLHPDVAPGYEELYRSDLGERTISRKEFASSPLGGSFGNSMRSGAGSPLSGTMLSGSLGGTMGRSSSGAQLADMRTNTSTGSLPSLGHSSSVPTLGLRRMESHPSTATLGQMVKQDKEPKRGISQMSPEERKEREKEQQVEAMSRKMWSAIHGSKECMGEYLRDSEAELFLGGALVHPLPVAILKPLPCPGFQRALKGGGKLDWQNPEWDGATLLLKVVRTNELLLADYLMAIGADPMIPDKSGRNVFHWCAIEGNPAMLDLFLTAIGTNLPEGKLEEKDKGGDAPLHLAAYHGHLPIVRLLIRKQVDPFVLNDLGYSATDLAEAKRMWHIAQYLNEQKQQEEDKDTQDFKVRNFVRPCNLSRADELAAIEKLNPKKPKAKAAPKKK